MTKRKSKGAYMISAVAEMYDIHPQTLRLYEREGLLKPSRTEGNTRLYTDEDLQRLEFILSLARDLGVNISGIAIILQMRERMEEMQRQIQEFVQYIQNEVLARATAAADPSKGAIVPLRRPLVPAVDSSQAKRRFEVARVSVRFWLLDLHLAEKLTVRIRYPSCIPHVMKTGSAFCFSPMRSDSSRYCEAHGFSRAVQRPKNAGLYPWLS